MSSTRIDELNSEPVATSSFAPSTNAPQHCVSVEPTIGSAIWARFIEPYLAGVDPICQSIDVPQGVDFTQALTCIPADMTSREFRSAGHSVALVECATFAAIIEQYSHRSGSVIVRAATPELVEKAVAEVSAWFPAPDPPATSVSVDFWQSGQRMFTTSRSIDAPQWSDVGGHYPGEVGRDLDELMKLELQDLDGRVILWHGPPGTGKTSAIRTLARAWRPQAKFQIVLDPEPVFSHSANLMQVILNSYDSESEDWRVLVIEDADEIVRADNSATSQSLSRLLNVGDGIVGQGLKVLVLLTTNEPPARLHPALTRPGRCLANVAFRKFTRAEAADAFPNIDAATDPGGPRDLSLAEVLTGRFEESTDDRHGHYL